MKSGFKRSTYFTSTYSIHPETGCLNAAQYAGIGIGFDSIMHFESLVARGAFYFSYRAVQQCKIIKVKRCREVFEFGYRKSCHMSEFSC